MPIRLLPPEVAGKIAAGEVVERPASVVKELVENSIDAGATEVRVEVGEGGRRLIRVADNGCGIPAAEVALAFSRHATSKLNTADDLDRIVTLGFRGEALASIAAVSQVTVLTRPREQAVGQYLRVEGGRISRQEGRGSPAGTVVTVEHLFRNVPARLKFLRQPQTEAGHIHAVVTHYALAFPEIRFSLATDGRPTFGSAGNGKLYDVLIAAYGLEVVEQMLAITGPEGAEESRSCSGAESRSRSGEGAEEMAPVPSGPCVFGFIGVPALHRANRSHISCFVNRRWVQDRSLAHAVAQAYHTLLPVGRHPVAVVLLEVDPGEVDVNVHPTKREVKFRDGQKVFSAVQRAVRHTLVAHAPVPVAARIWPTPEWSASFRDWERRQTPIASAESRSRSGGEGEATPSQLAMGLYHPAGWPGGAESRSRPGAESRSRPGEELQPVGPVRLPLLRVVGQVGQTYIVAEGPQGIYLIDQHAAHERVLYEQVLAEHKKQAVTSQALLEPLALDLDPLLAGILAEHLAMLNQVGFRLEPFGGTSFLLRAVPAILAAPDGQQGTGVRTALVDILDLLRQGDDPLADQAEERLVAAVCKRAAIKAGQTLSPEEMQQLVRQLEQCESPRTCPHGRPTVIHFSVGQLEKEFGRR